MRPRAAVLLVALVFARQPSQAAAVDTITVRGRSQEVHLFGVRHMGATPVIVSSGDGGWIHLAPHVADILAARGYFVVGVNVRAYLRSFTSGTATLQPADVAADYRELVAYAGRGTSARPVLVGISEGAGLSVLAAADGGTKALVGGVVAIGLPDVNELGWRLKDSWIYLSHGIPNEPTFSAAAFVSRVAPLPLAAIHSTQDEFVPVGQVQQMMAHASNPKRLWIVKASDHRFSDNLTELDRRLLEALTWVTANQPL